MEESTTRDKPRHVLSRRTSVHRLLMVIWTRQVCCILCYLISNIHYHRKSPRGRAAPITSNPKVSRLSLPPGYALCGIQVTRPEHCQLHRGSIPTIPETRSAFQSVFYALGHDSMTSVRSLFPLVPAAMSVNPSCRLLFNIWLTAAP